MFIIIIIILAHFCLEFLTPLANQGSKPACPRKNQYVLSLCIGLSIFFIHVLFSPYSFTNVTDIFTEFS